MSSTPRITPQDFAADACRDTRAVLDAAARAHETALNVLRKVRLAYVLALAAALESEGA